jgi:hypothetical protein
MRAFMGRYVECFLRAMRPLIVATSCVPCVHLRLTLVYCVQHEESMGGRGTITYVCDDSPADGLGYGDICKVETNTPGALNPTP